MKKVAKKAVKAAAKKVEKKAAGIVSICCGATVKIFSPDKAICMKCGETCSCMTKNQRAAWDKNGKIVDTPPQKKEEAKAALGSVSADPVELLIIRASATEGKAPWTGVLVLQGPEGSGKSEFIHNMLTGLTVDRTMRLSHTPIGAGLAVHFLSAQFVKYVSTLSEMAAAASAARG